MRLSKCFSVGTGSVLVTTTSRIGPFFKPVDGRAGEQAVRRARSSTDAAPRVDEQLGGADHGARGVDHVVDEDALAALDLTDDLGRDRDVVRALRAGACR